MVTALALWLLATGRWGSYVGNDDVGLFITEVWLGSAVLVLAVTAARGSMDFSLLRRPSLPIVLSASLLGLATARLIASDAATRDTLRDFAPYGYAAVAVLVLLSPRARWERSDPLAFAVLGAHAAWVALSANAPQLVVGLPVLGNAPVLSVRPDFDGTVCGLGVGVCAYWLRERAIKSRAAIAAVAGLGFAQAVLVLTLPSRAALLASVVTVAFVLWASAGRRRLRGSQLALRALVILVVALFTLVAVAQTVPGRRMVESIQGHGNAAGTTNARLVVWQMTADYVLAEPTRALFGVGFGPDFMHDTGADALFEGQVYTGVRSPHNYPLGTTARLGILGGILVLVLTAAAAVGSWRLLRRRRDLRAVDVLAAAVTVGLPVVAAVGVILESPFGAVPYFWAIGHLARVEHGAGGKLRSPVDTESSSETAEREVLT